MLYSYKINRKEDLMTLVESINNKLLDLVIKMIQDKDDIQLIFQQLKKEFKVSKTAITKEYIIRWYARLFENYQHNLLDLNNDIFSNLIDEIDFNEINLVKTIMKLVCMLSVHDDRYLN